MTVRVASPEGGGPEDGFVNGHRSVPKVMVQPPIGGRELKL